jgi:hypothetical protein
MAALPIMWPPADDVPAVLAHVRRTGSVEYPLTALASPVDEWVESVLAAAAAAGSRVVVLRSADRVTVVDPEH